MGLFRLLLALSVMTAHMGKAIVGFHQLRADIAVQCFYIISGFYMALILNEKYNRRHDYRVFLQQRVLRIYPTYAIVVVLFMVVETLVRNGSGLSCRHAWSEFGAHLSPGAAVFLVLVNSVIFGQDWLLFLALNLHTGNLYFTPDFEREAVPAYQFLICSPSWSLGVELMFYTLAPFLVRRSVGVQAGVVLASLGLRLVLYVFLGWGGNAWTYRFFPTQLAYFMAGSIGYQVYRFYGPQLKKFMTGRVWIAVLFWLSIFAYSRLPGSDEVRANCFAIVGAVMVPILFTAFRDNSIDRFLGELSYPLYLLHRLILYLLDPMYRSPFYSVLSLVLALGASALFYFYIERPLESYRARLFRRQRGREAQAR